MRSGEGRPRPHSVVVDVCARSGQVRSGFRLLVCPSRGITKEGTRGCTERPNTSNRSGAESRPPCSSASRRVAGVSVLSSLFSLLSSSLVFFLFFFLSFFLFSCFFVLFFFLQFPLPLVLTLIRENNTREEEEKRREEERGEEEREKRPRWKEKTREISTFPGLKIEKTKEKKTREKNNKSPYEEREREKREEREEDDLRRRGPTRERKKKRE